MARFVERRVELPATPERVWEHLTRRAMLERWFGGEIELEPTPGGTVRFRDERTELAGEVERCVPGEHLAWCWSLGDGGSATRVELDLSPDDDGTTLTVTETVVEVAARREDVRALAVA